MLQKSIALLIFHADGLKRFHLKPFTVFSSPDTPFLVCSNMYFIRNIEFNLENFNDSETQYKRKCAGIGTRIVASIFSPFCCHIICALLLRFRHQTHVLLFCFFRSRAFRSSSVRTQNMCFPLVFFCIQN